LVSLVRRAAPHKATPHVVEFDFHSVSLRYQLGDAVWIAVFLLGLLTRFVARRPPSPRQLVRQLLGLDVLRAGEYLARCVYIARFVNE